MKSSQISGPVLDEADKEDLLEILDDIQIIGVSFTNSEEDILEVRKFL